MAEEFIFWSLNNNRIMTRIIAVISFLCCSSNFFQLIDAWQHHFRWISFSSNSRISSVKLYAQGLEGADKLSVKKSSSEVRILSTPKVRKDNRFANMRNGTKETNSRKSKGKNVFAKDQLEFQKGLKYLHI